ncbi:hypothetical protein ACIQOW_09710 [Kitasatospora sp. NPDC091335]|uniref:hypothetical protein n=1 Tax=Kitasatospora sp. NPDC091335 TaxID=3364085 RepID=UPI0037F1D319
MPVVIGGALMSIVELTTLAMFDSTWAVPTGGFAWEAAARTRLDRSSQSCEQQGSGGLAAGEQVLFRYVRGGVGRSAGAEFDPQPVDVLVEIAPLALGRLGPATVEELLAMPDHAVAEDR